jgi:hemoglobin
MTSGVFERIGLQGIRAVIADFYDRVFDDMMIGFLFSTSDKQRLIEKECELAARFLGGDVRYTGKPLQAAHARHPIMGGHFDRRTQILRETLADHNVDAEVVKRWLDHTANLRDQITGDRGSECDHTTAEQRLRAAGVDPDSDPDAENDS